MGKWEKRTKNGENRTKKGGKPNKNENYQHDSAQVFLTNF
jgi:hypothetical protein